MAKIPAMQGIEFSDDTEIGIEPVSVATDFKRLVEDEAFMNEPVTIEIHPSTDENQPPVVTLNVNGTNQPVIRGVPTTIKRKYLEVLIRMKETKYTQHTPNPMEPDRIQTVGRTAQVYPYQILEDANPKGRAWAAHIQAEAA
jgi:hypothetical protein